MSEQPTPETDAAIVSAEYIRREMDYYEHKFVLADHARKFESQRNAAVAALKAARKTLSYCAVNPMQLHPSNNMQYIVASNALGDLDAAIDAARKGETK